MKNEPQAQKIPTASLLTEATVLLDKSPMQAQVVLCPSCASTLVIPPYDDALESVTACPLCTHAMNCTCTDCACTGEHEGYPAVMAYDEAEVKQVADALVEAGKRHSSKDANVLRQIVDLVKTLGIEVIPPAPVAGSEAESVEEAPVVESAAEPVAIEIAESSESEEITFRESGSMGEYVSLREADAVFNPDKREIIITPIRPGWGNAKDGYYYTEGALKEAVENGIFNGRPVKMYANHPNRVAEAALPERSVWDWVSTMRETWWDAEKSRPQSRIKVYDDRFWSRAVQAPDEIAFSILGGGRSRRGRIDNREARIVESLSQIRSVDWVTEAGAGGAIERFAESAHEEFEMDLKNLTAEQLKEGNPELYEAIVAMAKIIAPEAAAEETPEAPVETPEAPVAEAAPVETPEAPVEETVVEPVAEPVVEAAPTEETPAVDPTVTALEEMRKELDQVKRQLADKELAEAVAKNKTETAAFVADVIKESTLPAVAKNQVAEKFREATAGEGYLYNDNESLKTAIERELAERQALIDELTGGKSRVRVPSPVENPELGIRESVAKRLEDKWGAAPKPAQSSVDGVVVVEDEEEDAAQVSEAAAAVAARMSEKFRN